MIAPELNHTSRTVLEDTIKIKIKIRIKIEWITEYQIGKKIKFDFYLYCHILIYWVICHTVKFTNLLLSRLIIRTVLLYHLLPRCVGI